MKFNYILSAIVGGVLTLGAASCTDEVEYDSADKVAGEGFYLSDTGSAEVSIDENATSVAIPVYRTNSEGTATVKLDASVADEDGNPVTGIFTVPTEVTFADGATETNLNVGVDFSKIEALAEYTLTVKLLTDQTTPYSLPECVYTLSYAPWTEWYFYSTTDPGFVQYNAMTSMGVDVPVIIRYSLVDKRLMQIGIYNVFSDADLGYIFTLDVTPENQFNPDQTADLDAEYLDNLPEDEPIDVTKLKMNYYVTSNLLDTEILNSYYNRTMWIADVYTYFTQEEGLSAAEALQIMENNGYERSYFNPVSGRVEMLMVPYLPEPDGGVFTQMINWEYLQLPGVFKEYSISLKYNGNFVGTDGTENAIINVTSSKDVVGYTYKVINGTITEDEFHAIVEDMIADNTLEMITDNNTISLALPEAGKYTVVAVGYDNQSNAQCNTRLTFTYESVQKDNPWTSLGICEYTDAFLVDFYGGQIGGETWEVEIQESKETPGVYRLVNPYREWEPNVERDYVWSLEGNYYLVINAADPDAVYVETSYLGLELSPDDGQIIASSVAANNIANGATLAQQKRIGNCGKLKDGIISFPAKKLITFWQPDGEDASGAYCPEVATDIVDMSFIGARAPQKAAKNRTKAFNGPLDMRRTSTSNEVKAKSLIKSSTMKSEDLLPLLRKSRLF